MEEKPKTPPIEEKEFLYGVKVVDIGDLRVARGLSRRPYSSCCHYRMVYDGQERRVWCKDCEQDVEAFDAFKLLVENIASEYRKLNRLREEIEEAKEHTLHLIAAKEVEKVWRGRKMAPTCPHCKGGLLPEDFVNAGRTSAEFERKRRKQKAGGE